MALQKEIELKIDGMSCEGCSSLVKKTVEDLDGVENCEVNLAKGAAKLSYHPDQIDTEKILLVLNATTFQAAVIKN